MAAFLAPTKRQGPAGRLTPAAKLFHRKLNNVDDVMSESA